MKRNYNKLTDEEKRVIVFKGTEEPFTGKYDNFFEKGTYVCKRCNTPLYRSGHKFDAGCGWPSFDDEIKGAIIRKSVMGGLWQGMEEMWEEIICAHCKAHLGHVFMNEGLTPKNIRHCVNSISLKFIPEKS